MPNCRLPSFSPSLLSSQVSISSAHRWRPCPFIRGQHMGKGSLTELLPLPDDKTDIGEEKRQKTVKLSPCGSQSVEGAQSVSKPFPMGWQRMRRPFPAPAAAMPQSSADEGKSCDESVDVTTFHPSTSSYGFRKEWVATFCIVLFPSHARKVE